MSSAAPDGPTLWISTAGWRRPSDNEATFTLCNPVGPEDVPGLCRRLRLLLESSPCAVVVCDVGAIRDPDAVAIDVLARLHVIARRYGREFRLRGLGAELRDLIILSGLDGVLALDH